MKSKTPLPAFYRPGVTSRGASFATLAGVVLLTRSVAAFALF
ncbi:MULTISPECIES: hypothetical protein [Pseudomonas]|nr:MULTISPECIES: hypothetical protein [Pseudomonas]